MSTIEKHDMTRGKILLPLVSFTIPLVLGNLFQLTYNAADSVIVGKYVGEQALAAVGTSTPIMNIAILLISGMCMGASVLMSSQYGARDYDTLSKQISTTMLAGCGFSMVFSLLMLLLATPVLRLIRVPETAIPEAAVYLRIIFLGLIFTFIYNFLANTMRALGDSKTPLYFLVTSAFLNIFGDLFFVLAHARLAKSICSRRSITNTATTLPNIFIKVLYSVTFRSPMPRKNPWIPLVIPGRIYIQEIRCR
jgi:Na+-driven multidrug efflux pump